MSRKWGFSIISLHPSRNIYALCFSKASLKIFVSNSNFISSVCGVCSPLPETEVLLAYAAQGVVPSEEELSEDLEPSLQGVSTVKPDFDWYSTIASS